MSAHRGLRPGGPIPDEPLRFPQQNHDFAYPSPQSSHPIAAQYSSRFNAIHCGITSKALRYGPQPSLLENHYLYRLHTTGSGNALGHLAYDTGYAVQKLYLGTELAKDPDMRDEEQMRAARIGGLRLHNAPIQLAEYSAEWPVLYTVEAQRVRSALGNQVLLLSLPNGDHIHLQTSRRECESSPPGHRYRGRVELAELFLCANLQGITEEMLRGYTQEMDEYDALECEHCCREAGGHKTGVTKRPRWFNQEQRQSCR